METNVGLNTALKPPGHCPSQHPGAKLKSLASSWKAWEKPQKTQSEPAEEDEDEEIEVQDEPDSPESLKQPRKRPRVTQHSPIIKDEPQESPRRPLLTLRCAEADPSAEDISTSPQTHRPINNFVDVLKEMEDIISELEALKGRCEQVRDFTSIMSGHSRA
ncbi:hypothetical protein BC834DRAFT_977025 [Gloeopeniophorella convolvens]|nr:hypothetical protein BC834DRAFT_977025 [Gloeopeniophorella convolvens]